MPRYKFTIEYDGTAFYGWQRQKNQISVQQVLEEAVLKFSGETVNSQAAGRTDAGVHALGQVAHINLSKEWDPFRIREAMNYHMRKHRVVIVECEAVPDTFEARFSAKARHYEYRILTRRAPPALELNQVWHVPKPLDVTTMHEAAQLILGLHDFTTFRSSECQAKSPMRSLDELNVTGDDEYISVTASARSFLHHQVRSMVGSLKMVGEGKWTPADFRAALDAADRTRCGAMAPSTGLYFVGVDY
ncbi:MULTISPECIES: tRNA pseudouridine(38-40) synthase TruA [unclassified Devosia]|uniref:tRNA pseudouridine(38-40) synthase TruA n=1 Tax=unclassified Devosia TaxID=196773 RepID=UPI00145E3D2F|nr:MULTISPECIES: tRNA pseudouridine(38-40) synthase TruA [unclassified Devosia]MBJ6988781.1 tRNA pseudouridine(38-40) synthase TruA [Devosia sp. MC521]QMW63084.1 tRNA pseudouridine(38-40) synthase TruA [Devosia sp. MC521]